MQVGLLGGKRIGTRRPWHPFVGNGEGIQRFISAQLLPPYPSVPSSAVKASNGQDTGEVYRVAMDRGATGGALWVSVKPLASAATLAAG